MAKTRQQARQPVRHAHRADDVWGLDAKYAGKEDTEEALQPGGHSHIETDILEIYDNIDFTHTGDLVTHVDFKLAAVVKKETDITYVGGVPTEIEHHWIGGITKTFTINYTGDKVTSIDLAIT